MRYVCVILTTAKEYQNLVHIIIVQLTRGLYFACMFSFGKSVYFCADQFGLSSNNLSSLSGSRGITAHKNKK
jgi:hypothetical protein